MLSKVKTDPDPHLDPCQHHKVNNDDVSHCRILSRDKTEWRLISAILCGWRRCFVVDQLWFMTRIREEEELLEGHPLSMPTMFRRRLLMHSWVILLTDRMN